MTLTVTFDLFKVKFVAKRGTTIPLNLLVTVKADMNSYIPLETAAIYFLAKLFLKHGISSEYVMVDFICMGLRDLFGTRTENYKMNNSCPQWDSNPGLSAYEANALSVELSELINIDQLKASA